MGQSSDSRNKDKNADRRTQEKREPAGSKKNQKFGDSDRRAAERRGTSRDGRR